MRLLSALLPLAAFLASASALNINHFKSSNVRSDTLLGSASTLHYETHTFSLQDVGGEQHVEFSHASFPNHRVRIKSTTGWCDPDVNSYSGYIRTAADKDLFFYFFESRSKPQEDPLLLWINGGPGCSSSLGLFMELGPCTIADPTHVNGTKPNPHSWNNKANLLILDQPIEVGFSHGKHGTAVRTTEEAAVDVQAFVTIFVETFKEFEGRAFFMSGESYGGRYLPVFASAVVDGNDHLVAQNKTPINLQGVLIGNGITDSYKMIEAYGQHQCITVPGMKKPYQNIGTCVEIAKSVPFCSKSIKADCVENHNTDRCNAALLYCSEIVDSTFFALGLNPYDVSMSCNREELSDGLCYGSITHPINQYLDLPEVRELFGVDKSVGGFASCTSSVGINFNIAGDRYDKTWLYVAALLERGIEVISYVGTLDWICNYIGNQAWLDTLEWTGGAEYAAVPLREWTVDGKVAGATKTYGGLTFASVYSAGHMVPFDKPVEALALLNRYMAGGGKALSE